MITSLLPAWLETRICLRLRQHGLNPVYLVQCLFLLCSLFLCVAYSCVVVDKKDHTTGAIHLLFIFELPAAPAAELAAPLGAPKKYKHPCYRGRPGRPESSGVLGWENNYVYVRKYAKHHSLQ